jgi:hypothetical protein
MGKYVTDLIFPAQDLGESGTEIIPIRTKNVISRIELTYKTTKGSQGMSVPAPANIPKIELVDGAKPLHSLTGYTNQALAYYNRPGVSMEHGQHISTLSEVDMYSIDFGRFLWDEMFAFDPKRFGNPQLKVTYDEDLSDTSADGGTLEVWAEEFDEKVPSPIGFLKALEVWSGNFLAENSVNEILLPDDEVIRQILVRAHEAGYEPWHQVDIAKLDQQGDGKVIFDYEDLEMFYRRMKGRWQPINTQFSAIADTGGKVFYIPQSDYYAAVIIVGASASVVGHVALATTTGGKVTLTGSANDNCVGQAFGYLPWSTFQFPMGVMSDPDTWYDPKDKGPRLRVTSNTGGASGDGNVVLETVHKYGS